MYGTGKPPSPILLSRPPQAGSKFVATQKYLNRTNTSLSFPYIWLSADDWLLGVVKCGGVNSSRFLGGFRVWGLGLPDWTRLKEVVVIWLASTRGETAARFFVVATQTPRVRREGKTGLSLGVFKFRVSVLYLAFRAPA